MTHYWLGDDRSGQYSTDQVLRWQQGSGIQLAFQHYWSTPKSHADASVFSRLLVRNYGGKAEDFCVFLELVAQLSTRVQLSETELQECSRVLNKTCPSGHDEYSTGLNVLILMKKLMVAYHNEQLLSTAEKIAIMNVVKIVMPPQKLPEAMRQYSRQLPIELQALNRNNPGEVAQCIAEQFYQFVDIHPFDNGNGRVATWLSNVILRGLGYPAILLRLPGENEDASSLYSRAFEHIDDNRETLKQLIRLRLETPPFVDVLLKCKIENSVCLALMCEQILKIQPNVDLDSYTGAIVDSLPTYLTTIKHPKLVRLLVSQFMMAQLLKDFSTVFPPDLTLPAQGMFFAIPKSVIANISGKLNAITSSTDWKAYQKGQMFLLQTKSENDARSICSELTQRKIGKVNVTQLTSDRSVWVVKVTEIQYNRLMQSQLFSPPLAVGAITNGLCYTK